MNVKLDAATGVRPPFPPDAKKVVLTNQPIHNDGGTLRLGKGPDAPELLVADLPGPAFAAAKSITTARLASLEGSWVMVGKKTKREAFLASSLSLQSAVR